MPAPRAADPTHGAGDERLRPATDGDADALIALVGAAYAEHPGCVLDLPGIDADLEAPASAAAAGGGRWWVLEHPRDGVIATVGAGPVERGEDGGADGSVELKRLYVDAAHRRRGLASRLVALVEHRARQLGADAVHLWSDARFDDAHRLYTRLGYRDTGRRRDLHDPSDTTEIEFVRRLADRR